MASISERLFLPDSSDGLVPGIVFCPGLNGDVQGLMFLLNGLRRAGMAVLAASYRGGDMRVDPECCEQAVNDLLGQADVDPARIGIAGHSRGAMAALRTAAVDRRIKSVAAFMPVAHFDELVAATQRYAPYRYEQLVTGLGGTPEDMPDDYARMSPIQTVAQIQGPVLLVAGTNDLHTPQQHARQLHEHLVAAGNANARLEVLDRVGHFFERAHAGYVHDEAAALAVSWFQRTLR
jgi:dipeptidyl aminopeptidase/acylaminoacyl peptidase